MGRRPALLNIDNTFMFVDPNDSMCGREMESLVVALGTTSPLNPIRFSTPKIQLRTNDQPLMSHGLKIA